MCGSVCSCVCVCRCLVGVARFSCTHTHTHARTAGCRHGDAMATSRCSSRKCGGRPCLCKGRRKKNRKGPSRAPRSVLLPIISVLSRLRATRPEAALVSQGTVACCLAAEFGRSGAAGSSSRCCSLSMQLLLLSWRCSRARRISHVCVRKCLCKCECESKYYESQGCVQHVNFLLFPKSSLSKCDLCVYEVSLCALSISSTHHSGACT